MIQEIYKVLDKRELSEDYLQGLKKKLLLLDKETLERYHNLLENDFKTLNKYIKSQKAPILAEINKIKRKIRLAALPPVRAFYQGTYRKKLASLEEKLKEVERELSDAKKKAYNILQICEIILIAQTYKESNI